MSDFNFKATNCPKCGQLVWDGLTNAGIPAKLDTPRLTVTDEIKLLTSGTATYQIHRTSKSFEVTRRMAGRMTAKDPIVLGHHKCASIAFFFGESAPDYFNRVKPKPTETDEVPF